MSEIYDAIEKNEGMMQSFLKTVVEMESPSLDKELVDEFAEWVADAFEKLTGGRSEIVERADYGNHVKVEWGEGEEQLLVLGHLDTVWPRGTIKKMPYTVKNGVASGPGVFDMKGGIIQGLFAVKALQDLGVELDRKVVFLFDSDEEIGNPSSKKLIEEEAARSERVFVLEPAMGETGSLKTSRKGVGIFELEATGIPAHAGIDPEKGVSAIEELALQTVELHGMTDLDVGTTFNIGKIEGGTTSNVIAEKAEVTLDVRVKTQGEADRVLPIIQQLQPKLDGAELKVMGGFNRPPLERTESIVAMYQKAKELAAEQLDMELTEQESGGGSDGNLTAPYAPTLDGLGPVGGGAHANDEHLILSEMTKRSALFALLLMEYGRKEQ